MHQVTSPLDELILLKKQELAKNKTSNDVPSVRPIKNLKECGEHARNSGRKRKKELSLILKIIMLSLLIYMVN